MEGRWLQMGQRAGSPAPCPGNESDCSCCKHQARGDEELTNLNWLHENKNLLTAMSLAGQAPAASQAPQVKETPLSPSQTPHEPQEVAKPPYSFNCLIFMAIEGSPAQCLPVKEIYKWILEHYPYFQQAPVGWKNSALGKGSFWCIDEESRPNLLQAVRKRTLYIHSAPLGSSAPVLPNTPDTQDTDGEIEEQPHNVNQEPGVTATRSHNGTNVTINQKNTLTNSSGLPFLPLRRESCLKRCHNSSPCCSQWGS
ncbi:forkhead box protein N2-like isoform X2 [Scyliorhinus torazame]|uniref:forkhead box protein N2-like isoform X2 n=1 Tax=Scyliorhinus torazame TaxID=75743 RepID=UPI003B5CDD2E